MAKKKSKSKQKEKEIDLDDLEEELSADDEDAGKIEEIEEFDLDEISDEEEIEEIFEEEVEPLEEEIEAPKEEIIDERLYTVPLAKARRGPRNKYSKKAIRFLKEFMNRHMKPEALVISQEVNEAIWKRGIQKPPRKLKVRVTKNVDGLCVIYLA
ncbi:MAG: 60S ribosomal protein L31 [Candidatus Lokiarchaeota archaeon]|nr:60S ribosomal protein L31 [Candidatus Lokiarchaeota archaeon]